MAGMTKDDLKTALTNHGVDLPSAGAKKDELKALYEEHVLTASERSNAEFSSDEELELTPEGGGKRKKKRMPVDVTLLPDEQLLEALQEHGIEVGPVVDSTRRFYQKKLTIAIHGEPTTTEETDGRADVSASGRRQQAELNGTNGGEKDTNGFVVGEAEFSADDEDLQPSAEVKKVPAARVSPPGPKPTLRQRFGGSPATGDESPPSGGRQGRFTPTPRRSIHSYKVRETTKMTITKNKDGTTSKDHDYRKETFSSDGVEGGSTSSRGRLYSFLRLLPGFFLLVIALVLAYYVYMKREWEPDQPKRLP